MQCPKSSENKTGKKPQHGNYEFILTFISVIFKMYCVLQVKMIHSVNQFSNNTQYIAVRRL